MDIEEQIELVMECASTHDVYEEFMAAPSGWRGYWAAKLVERLTFVGLEYMSEMSGEFNLPREITRFISLARKTKSQNIEADFETFLISKIADMYYNIIIAENDGEDL